MAFDMATTMNDLQLTVDVSTNTLNIKSSIIANQNIGIGLNRFPLPNLRNTKATVRFNKMNAMSNSNSEMSTFGGFEKSKRLKNKTTAYGTTNVTNSH